MSSTETVVFPASRLRALAVAVSISTVGCPIEEPEPLAYPIPTGPIDGRLVLFGWDGGNGATIVQTIQDGVLGVTCKTDRDTRGFRRCIPTQLARTYYLDETCSGSTVIDPHGVDGVVPPYVRISTQQCGAMVEFEVHQVREQRSLRTVYDNASGTCRPVGLSTPTYYHSIVDPMFLAEIVVRTVQLDDRFDRREDWSPDGTYLGSRIFDRDVGRVCRPTLVGTDLQCGPTEQRYTMFDNASCQSDGDFFTNTTCERDRPNWAWTSSAACGAAAVMIVEEASADHGTLYFPATATDCLEQGPQPAQRVTVRRPSEVLGALERENRGTGRLVVPVDGADWFFDTILGVACRPEQIGTDFRCIPSRSFNTVRTLHTDAECRIAANFATGYGVPGDVVIDADGGLFEAGALQDPALVYQISLGECEAVSSDSLFTSFGCPVIVAIGAPISPNRFATVENGPLAP